MKTQSIGLIFNLVNLIFMLNEYVIENVKIEIFGGYTMETKKIF